MITTDYHVHTKFSTDSVEEMESSVKAAIGAGLTGVAFTEHLDLDFPEKYRKSMAAEMGKDLYIKHPDFDKRPLFTFDIPAYFDEINKVRSLYGEEIQILSGFEAGMRPGRTDLVKEYEDLRKEYNFQIVLGSLHLLGDDDPYLAEVWEGKNPDYVVARYFDELAQCVDENNYFDSLAHMDYVVRYVPSHAINMPLSRYFNYIPEKNRASIDFILKTIISRGKALEINTKAMGKGLGHAHPSEAILNRYRELGGNKFTYGSDAHTADFVGKGIIK